MFKKAQNIDSAFRLIKGFCIMFCLFCITVSALALYEAYRILRIAGSRVYVLSASKVMEAFAVDRRDNLAVEARDHIRNFHESMFTLDPDEKVISANIGRALYLADGSAKRLYDNLKENGYYAGVIAGNISQQIGVDSIDLRMETYPYYFKCWATQTIIRPTSIVTRSLVTEGWIRNTSRSDHDPHGLLIERWSTLENKDLKVTTR